MSSTLETNKNVSPRVWGEFSFADGKLQFTCHEANATFKEVLEAVTALRDEVQSQIDNQSKCPYHTVE